MEKKRKIHLIEVLVLIALLFIFVPLFFPRIFSKTYVRYSNPPDFPASQKTAITFSDVPEFSENKLTFSSQPKAWLIQLGSFALESNAEKLLAQLQAMKLHAFTYTQKQLGRVVTRVYVGPETSRAEAEELLKTLQAKVDTKGIIVPFNPLQI